MEDSVGLTLNLSWQLEIVGRLLEMPDGTAQSQCLRYLQPQEGRCISGHAASVLCI